MKSTDYGRLFSLFVMLIVVIASSSSIVLLTVDECRKAGLNRDSLSCSSCNELQQFDLDALTSTCRQCCQDDESANDAKKYPMAHIEVCECNLARFPQIQAFVKSDKVKQWGMHVQVRHVRGVLPTIRLKDEFGETQQTMNIEKWDTDTVTEFLNTWLEY